MPTARGKGGFISKGIDPVQAPDAPTIGAVTVASGTSLSVAFTAPSDTGGAAIDSYAVIAYDSSGNAFSATGSSSPITVSGLTTGTEYTCQVQAINVFGSSQYSGTATGTPAVQGQEAYTSAGTYSFTAPTGVTSVSVVAVGGGGGSGGTQSGSTAGDGGGGPGLRYGNNISVTAGNSYTVVVGDVGVNGAIYTHGQNGGDSSFNGTDVVAGGGFGTGAGRNGNGGSGSLGSGISGGGGDGGQGSPQSNGFGGGGGGAAGYSGNGGNGAAYGATAQSGSGGGGGGGTSNSGGNAYGLSGGGVGIYGQGTNGAGGTSASRTGGSGSINIGDGVGYGRSGTSPGTGSYAGPAYGGKAGAVRIIWPGSSRQFPSTGTTDV
tara:strand:+ start:3023 stop:4153 length:1131 start_codon:yes stop_codon:yes gene_type:complete